MNEMTLEKAMTIIRGHQEVAPVDILKISSALRLEVYTSDFNMKKIAGKIIKSDKYGGMSGYAIIVNENDPPVRKRFTIAHEISHYLLHRDQIGDGLVDDGLYRSGLSNKLEVDANKLAADILMPWHLINKALDDKIESIEELAKRFDVSESAMSIRLGIP